MTFDLAKRNSAENLMNNSECSFHTAGWSNASSLLIQLERVIVRVAFFGSRVLHFFNDGYWLVIFVDNFDIWSKSGRDDTHPLCMDFSVRSAGAN